MPMSENFEKLRIYNLFPKLAGNMTEWTQHIPRIAEMGFNAIYVNPFHYCGFSGSLYSPSDYYRFNDQFIDNNSHIPPADQLKNFISKLHQHGMKFIMDLVINHTAIDSPLVKEHPEWYLRDDTGKVLNPFAVEHDGNKVVWGDLAEIDNEGSKDIDNLYKYWLDMIMHYMAMGVDGFRCDAAYKVPVKLWKYLNRNIRAKYPGALFLAETLGCEIHQVIALAEAGFDYTFNSAKYWNFNEPWLLKQYWQSYDKVRGIPSIGFPESHDTARLFEELKGNFNAIMQRYQFIAFFSSALMIPMGFENGCRKRLNVVTTTPSDMEPTGTDISDAIKKINAIKKSYKILNEECNLEIVDQANWSNVFCFRKTSFDGSERILVILNKDVNNYQGVHFENVNGAIGSDSKVVDISPMYTLDAVSPNFEYNLRPGQVIVLYSKKIKWPEFLPGDEL